MTYDDISMARLEAAAQRQAAYRRRNFDQALPDTRALDRAMVAGVAEFLRQRGITSLSHIMTPDGKVKDEVAFALVRGVFKALAKVGVDVKHEVTIERVYARLGLMQRPPSRRF